MPEAYTEANLATAPDILIKCKKGLCIQDIRQCDDVLGSPLARADLVLRIPDSISGYARLVHLDLLDVSFPSLFQPEQTS